MKIAVFGSKNITNREWIWDHLDRVVLPIHQQITPVVLMSGDKGGVDKEVKLWCEKHEIDHVVLKPNFLVSSRAPYNASDFILRNRQLLDNAHRVVVLWNGEEVANESGEKDLVYVVRNLDPNGFNTVVTYEAN